MNAVTIGELKSVVRKLHAAGKLADVALYLSGPPGIGKSATFEQMAREFNADHKIFLACTMDPTDITGLPFPVEGMTRFLPPERLLSLTDRVVNPKFTIAVFDDLPATHEQVFAALFRLFYERYVGDDPIRKNVLLCATGNRAADMAGAKELPTALANRFIHFEIRVDVDEWVTWAYQNEVDPMVIAFVLSSSGRYLHDFDPSRGEICFPSPRSVTLASLMYSALGHKEPALLLNSLAGCCGESWAHAFTTFAQMREKLVPVEEIFAQPSVAPIPNELDVCWAVISNVGCAVARQPIPAFINAALIYAMRFMHRDMGAKLCRDVVLLAHQTGRTDIYDGFVDTLTEAKRKFGNLLTLRGSTAP